MADMVLRPTYPDIDSERQVVIEEIAMYEDEPSDKVHDVLAAAIFGDHPLGRPIIGRAEVISVGRRAATSRPTTTRATCRPNIVVAAAGQHRRTSASSSWRARPRASARRRRRAAAAPSRAAGPATPRVRFHAKQTEQYHLCLGGPGIARGDDRRFALRVLDTLLGGSTSSRLFQEVREKRGLAYSVYSYASQYVDAGQVGDLRRHAARQRRARRSR